MDNRTAIATLHYGRGVPIHSLRSLPQQVLRRAVLRYSIHNRNRKADAVTRWIAEQNCRNALFIGTIGAEHAKNPNMVNAGIVERRVASSITVKMSINIEPALTPYPFQLADARDLPFENDYVDFALANAIIEHVGDESDQLKMIKEMTRVARCWVVTTPNKWFPVESHTTTVLLHWLPWWRERHSDAFTRLLSRREFAALLPKSVLIRGGILSPTFTAYYARPLE